MAINTLDLHWALTATLPPFDFVLPGLLPGGFGLMVAPGATGKSQLALDIAISMSLGRASAKGLFPAMPPAKVVMLAGEEGERVIAERLRAHLDLSERATPSLYDYLTLLPMAGETCTLIDGGKTTPLFGELAGMATGARLIIIDPLRRMHNGDENNSSEMTVFVVAMEQLARATGAAVLGLHHANRASSADGGSQNAARGSSALVDGARWQMNLSRMDEKTAQSCMLSDSERALYVAVDFPKTNYIAPRPRCWLKRKPGGQLALASLPLSKPKTRSFGGARTL